MPTSRGAENRRGRATKIEALEDKSVERTFSWVPMRENSRDDFFSSYYFQLAFPE
jgi:hypothetical protein